MISASAMSAAIRAKKKQKEDATDLAVEKQHEATEGLDENMPASGEMSEEASEGDDEDPMKMAKGGMAMKHAKIKAMMMRMKK